MSDFMSNYEYFLNQDMSLYTNEWIAIVNEKIVSHGRSVKKVYKEAKNRYPTYNPLLTKIPSKQTAIFYS